MEDEVQEIRSETRKEGDTTVSRRSVTRETSDEPALKAQQFIYFIYGTVAGLLAIRIILSLFGANRANDFANFIYSVTNPFVAPFRGLFGYDVQYGISRFEIETLVAIIVYGLVAWLLMRLVDLGKKSSSL